MDHTKLPIHSSSTSSASNTQSSARPGRQAQTAAPGASKSKEHENTGKVSKGAALKELDEVEKFEEAIAPRHQRINALVPIEFQRLQLIEEAQANLLTDVDRESEFSRVTAEINRLCALPGVEFDKKHLTDVLFKIVDVVLQKPPPTTISLANEILKYKKDMKARYEKASAMLRRVPGLVSQAKRDAGMKKLQDQYKVLNTWIQQHGNSIAFMEAFLLCQKFNVLVNLGALASEKESVMGGFEKSSFSDRASKLYSEVVDRLKDVPNDEVLDFYQGGGKTANNLRLLALMFEMAHATKRASEILPVYKDAIANSAAEESAGGSEGWGKESVPVFRDAVSLLNKTLDHVELIPPCLEALPEEVRAIHRETASVYESDARGYEGLACLLQQQVVAGQTQVLSQIAQNAGLSDGMKGHLETKITDNLKLLDRLLTKSLGKTVDSLGNIGFESNEALLDLSQKLRRGTSAKVAAVGMTPAERREVYQQLRPFLPAYERVADELASVQSVILKKGKQKDASQLQSGRQLGALAQDYRDLAGQIRGYLGRLIIDGMEDANGNHAGKDTKDAVAEMDWRPDYLLTSESGANVVEEVDESDDEAPDVTPEPAKKQATSADQKAKEISKNTEMVQKRTGRLEAKATRLAREAEQFKSHGLNRLGQMRAERKVGEGNTWKSVENLLNSSLDKKTEQAKAIDDAIAVWADDKRNVKPAAKAENITRLQTAQKALRTEVDALEKNVKRGIAEALTLDVEDKDNDWLDYVRQHMHITLQKPTIEDLGVDDDNGNHVPDWSKEHQIRVKAYPDDPSRFTFKCVRHAHVDEDGNELKSHKKRWDQRNEGTETVERHNRLPEGARYADDRRSYRVYYGHETEAGARAIYELEMAQNSDPKYWEPTLMKARADRR